MVDHELVRGGTDEQLDLDARWAAVVTAYSRVSSGTKYGLVSESRLRAA